MGQEDRGESDDENMFDNIDENSLHDDQLRLIFTYCRAALSLDVQVSKTLRTIVD